MLSKLTFLTEFQKKVYSPGKLFMTQKYLKMSHLLKDKNDIFQITSVVMLFQLYAFKSIKKFVNMSKSFPLLSG